LFWIALIFFFSSTVASAAHTSRFIEPILRFFWPASPAETIEQSHRFIRKCAHFFEYSLLAFWALRAWARSTNASVVKYRFVFAILLVLAIACLDELNQSLEPSRTSTPWDVVLDVIAGAAMTVALKLWGLRKPICRPRADASG
jgi:VanZ family protein